MTIEEYYKDKKASASEGCTADADSAVGMAVMDSAKDEYITIRTRLYTGLVRDSELLGVVIRILSDKRIADYKLADTLAAVLDLPYEQDDA